MKRGNILNHRDAFASEGATIHFTDGTSNTFTRLERPHLIFDSAGMITHLVNGVQPPPTAGKSPPTAAKFQNDYVYTLVQPVAAATGPRNT